MPIVDSRQLIFDEQSLRGALRGEGRVRQHLRLPQDEPQDVTMLPGEHSVELFYAPHAYSSLRQPMLHRLNPPQIAALLIAYCIRSGVPVPRRCEKTITVQENRITLSFTKTIQGRF